MKKSLLFVLFVSIFFSPAYATGDGLVAYYSFDEGNGTVAHDYSGNGNDGTVYGATWTEGVSGSGLGFDGINDYVYLGNKPSLYAESMTLMEWLKFTDNPSGCCMWTINDGSGDQGEWGINIGLNNNGVIASAGAGPNDHYLITQHTELINDDNWHFVVTTYNNSDKRLRLYVDGNLVAINDPNADRTFTLADNLSHKPSLYSWYIGRLSQGVFSHPFYKGGIDEVKIYNRSLSTEEIRTEYKKYAGNGLVAYYNFDENAGDIAHDYSGNGNDGQIQGVTWNSDSVNGSALSFDGTNDYVSVPTSPDLNFGTENFTINFWVNFNDLQNGDNGLIHKDNFSGSWSNMKGWLFNICDGCGTEGWGVGSGGVGLEVRNKANGFGPHANARYATSNFQTNKWYNLVGVRESNVLKLYVNGILRATTLEPAPIDVSNDIDLRIGSLSPASPQFFNGIIDEIRIYNRALTPEEIKQEYEKYTKPAEPLDSDSDGLPDLEEIAYELDPHHGDTDSDGINDSTEYDLLEEYMPVFQYTEETLFTEFYPEPVNLFQDHSKLYNSSGIVLDNLSGETISSYGSNYYLDFNEMKFYKGSLLLDIYKNAYTTLRPAYGDTLYMRAVPSNDNEYIVLQYWHHYLYNLFINPHEGDWEMAEVLLNKTTLEPRYAVYGQHEDSYYRNGGEIKEWGAVQKSETHPVIYVARGSHASYFEAANWNVLKWVRFMGDYTSSAGLKIDNETFGRRIILRDGTGNLGVQSWQLYGGRWGNVLISNDTDILHTNGPFGPRYQVEKWYSPAEWGLKYLTRQLIQEYVVARLETGALTVRDAIGREVAFVNNAIIKQIPKAEVISVGLMPIYILPLDDGEVQMMSLSATAATSSADYVYIIEPNGTYEFELYFANETEANHIVFSNVSGANGTRDNVWIEEDAIYMNTTDTLKGLNVMLEYMNDTYEKNISLTGIAFGGNETLAIQVKDWINLGEPGSFHVKTRQKQCRLKEGCDKIKYMYNGITGHLLEIFGPSEMELTHWNDRSGKSVTK